MAGLINIDVSSLAKSITEPITAAIKKGIDLATIEKDVEKNLQDFFASQNSGQIEINKIEASSENIFKSGWRPFIGWICAFGILWAYGLQPIFIFFDIGTPQFNSEGVLELVLALLGMAGIRSFEKIKKVIR